MSGRGGLDGNWLQTLKIGTTPRRVVRVQWS